MSRTTREAKRERREFRRGDTRRRPVKVCPFCGCPAMVTGRCARRKCAEKTLSADRVDWRDGMLQANGGDEMADTMTARPDGATYGERPHGPHYETHSGAWAEPTPLEWAEAVCAIEDDAREDAALFFRQCPGEMAPATYRGWRWELSQEDIGPSYFAADGSAALEPFYAQAFIAELRRLYGAEDQPS